MYILRLNLRLSMWTWTFNHRTKIPCVYSEFTFSLNQWPVWSVTTPSINGGIAWQPDQTEAAAVSNLWVLLSGTPQTLQQGDYNRGTDWLQRNERDSNLFACQISCVYMYTLCVSVCIHCIHIIYNIYVYTVYIHVCICAAYSHFLKSHFGSLVFQLFCLSRHKNQNFSRMFTM